MELKIKEIMFFSVKDYTINYGNQEIKVTKHFFMFLLRLAISYKQTEDWYSQGWCSIEKCLDLPGWENTLLRNAGKNTVRGLEAIEEQIQLVINDESETLVKKQHKAYVFKLNDVIIEDVQFDISIDKIIEKLFSRQINYSDYRHDSNQINNARQNMYVTGTINTAEVLFETGQRDLADKNLNDLLKTKSIKLSHVDKLIIYTTLAFFAYTSYQQEVTRKYLRQAEKHLDYSKDFIEDTSKYHARYWIFLARYYLRFHNDLEETKKHLDEASLYLNDNQEHYQEWGFYHVSRAIMAERKGDFSEAHRQHWASLNAWMQAKWWYGVQAAYYNLGELCLDAYKGRYASATKLSKEVKDQLLKDAEEWVIWCERFSRNSSTGEDMVWSSLKLASIYRYQNKVKMAISYLKQAKKVLDLTQDNAELAEYYLQLSKINIVQKNYADAKVNTKQALKYIKTFDSEAEKEELAEQLTELDSLLS